MKERVSHFISKGIPINETTRPVPAKVENIKPAAEKIKKDKIPKQATNRIARKVPAREWLKSESKYASTPRKQTSKLIDYVIQQDVDEFRDITNKFKKIRNDGETQISNDGETQISKKTNSSIDDPYV